MLPLDAGFGAADWALLAIAAPLVLLALGRARLQLAFRRLATSPWWCMALLAALPVVLRLALLPRFPAPPAAGADDFSYLLLADTLRHLRLSNPVHPMHQFFEAVFILQEPTYSSIYPLGPGIALALGWAIFGHPWAGVVLPIAAFCALCYWMLRGWVTPGWALAGGLLAAIQFGPLCEWMNCYWGGGVSALAGCLAFGALPRISGPRPHRAAALLGAGIGLQLLTRPFEAVLMALCSAGFLLPAWRSWRSLARPAALAALIVAPAVALMLLHNHAVTGRWTTMPYALSRYQYGIPATFTFQPMPTPHRQLTPEQQLDYQAQSIVHGDGPETVASYLQRWVERLRFCRFFIPAPLYLALPAFLLLLREFRYAWVAVALAIFSLGTNFYPYFYPHYIAAASCLLLLASVAALARLSAVPGGRAAALILLGLCGAQFLFWYGLHAFAPEKTLFAAAPYEAWDFIDYGDPEGRLAASNKLAKIPGRHLVFVHYGPRHAFHEWVYNDADIDAARVVRALDLGTDENEKLLRYYPDRRAWMVEPDATPPRLYPYAARLVTPPPAAPPPPEPRPALRLEQGPVNNPAGIVEVDRAPRTRR